MCYVEVLNSVEETFESGCALCFQRVVYHYEEDNSEDGFRFIWRDEVIEEISQLADTEAIFDWLVTSGLNIVIVIVLAVVGYWLLTVATRHLTRHMQQLDDEESSHFDLRIETIRRLVNTTALVIIIAVASLTILSELGISHS